MSAWVSSDVMIAPEHNMLIQMTLIDLDQSTAAERVLPLGENCSAGITS